MAASNALSSSPPPSANNASASINIGRQSSANAAKASSSSRATSQTASISSSRRASQDDTGSNPGTRTMNSTTPPTPPHTIGSSLSSSPGLSGAAKGSSSSSDKADASTATMATPASTASSSSATRPTTSHSSTSSSSTTAPGPTPSTNKTNATPSTVQRTPQPLPSKPIVLESAFDLLEAQQQAAAAAGQVGPGGHALHAAYSHHSHYGGGGSSSASLSSSGYPASRSPSGRAASLPNGSMAQSGNFRARGGSTVAPGAIAHQPSPQQQGVQNQVPASYAHGTPQWQAAQAHQQYHAASAGGGGSHAHKVPSPGTIPYERHCMELTSCIITFLGPILPTEEEYRVKEATRRQLERLAGRVSPGAKLLAFGSMANGFALRNSDMDLCCLTAETGDTTEPQPTASELVEILGQLIREETDFKVMPLPKARIPIIKINRVPTPDLPYEIACDIGFENRLALENTRLLLSYAMVDPPRLRTMVLFLKVWTKRRKLNSPFTGTLSSYGYTLMALYFLTHVKKPAVLPNLQRLLPSRPLSPTEVDMNGNNIYFYDDIATLRTEWQSQNVENVGELLIDFFRYFAKEFSYSRDVISLRTDTGTFPKDGVNWIGELCIEDPFQTGYNVSRPVTKDGLYTIRGEFIRASKILSNKQKRASTLIAELCKEREEGLARAPENPRHRQRYNGAYSPFDNPFRRHYGNASGIGGSFAFEAMARGLGKGQQNPLALLPTTAMLAPLSHNTGLTGKTGARTAKRKGSQSQAISSAKSDDGSGLHSERSTLTVPYNGVVTNGHALDQAIDLSDEFAGDAGARASRSFSDTLARSKSLPRQQMPLPGSMPRHSQPASPMTRAQMPAGGISPPVSDILSAMDGMSVNGETPVRQQSVMSDSGALQDSPYADISARSSPYYQQHSPWTFLVPQVGPYVPYSGPGSAAAAAAGQSRHTSQSSSASPASSIPVEAYDMSNTSSEMGQELPSLEEDEDALPTPQPKPFNKASDL